MGVLMSIPFSFNCASIYNIKEINSSFATGTLKVMYLGENRNGSHFSKDAVEKALPSLCNVPIVCHWDDQSEVIGGHDMELVKNEDGSFRLKNLTEPCGVVPDHASFYFTTECDDNGNEHEYLVVDGVILWKRQDVYRHIVEDLNGKVGHSMEITVKENSTMPNGYFDITDFEFTALCLLERDEPCFQGSELELYSAQNFRQKMEQMLLEIKEEFNLVNTSKDVDNKHPQEFSTEGGTEVLDKKMELVAEYGIDIEKLDFSIEDLTEEELKAKFEEMKNDDSDADPEPNADPKPTNTDDDNDDDKDPKPNADDQKFALTGEIVDELYRVLDEQKIEREWGECTRYWYVDCDFDAKEVYCWDTVDWLLYGFTYSMDGDAIIIDFESKKRKKYAIVDFDEGNQPSPFAEVFAQLEEKLKDSSEWEAKYNDASSAMESMQTELSELRQFKADTDKATADAEREAILSQFEDLAGIEAFELLRDNCSEYDAETLEEKCYAIRGRNGGNANFALETGAPKLKVQKTDTKEEPYGGLFVEYGISLEK